MATKGKVIPAKDWRIDKAKFSLTDFLISELQTNAVIGRRPGDAPGCEKGDQIVSLTYRLLFCSHSIPRGIEPLHSCVCLARSTGRPDARKGSQAATPQAASTAMPRGEQSCPIFRLTATGSPAVENISMACFGPETSASKA